MLATASSGVAHSKGLRNPNPTGTYLLKSSRWVLLFQLILLVGAIAMAGWLIRLSWIQGRVHHLLVIFLSGLGMCWTDPLGNWVTFIVFDPRLLHFPTTWSWVGLAPSIEPLVNVVDYPIYLIPGALLAAFVCNRFVLPRGHPGGRASRHPWLTFFAVGFAVGVVADIVLQRLMLQAGLYFYSQAWGPGIGAGHTSLPLLGVFYDVSLFAAFTMLMYRDDQGRTILHRIAERFPLRVVRAKAGSAGTQVLAGAVLLSVVVMVPIGVFAALRAHHMLKPNYTIWPYPPMKVYDPQGVLQKAGKPGPFYK
jgi:hypothetical protein